VAVLLSPVARADAVLDRNRVATARSPPKRGMPTRGRRAI